VVLLLGALGGPLRGELLLLTHGQFMTDDAADRRAGQGVVVGKVAGDAAHNGAADAAGLSLRRDGGERNGQDSGSENESHINLQG